MRPLLRRRLTTMTLIALVTSGLALAEARTPTAFAADGTAFRVGMLVDEAFSYFDGNYVSPAQENKISGWEVSTRGGTYSNGEYTRFVVSDTSATEGVSFRKRFVDTSAGAVTMYFRFTTLSSAMDGISWSLADGRQVGVSVGTAGGNIVYGTGGSTIVLAPLVAEVEYGVKIVADLAVASADVYINGERRADDVPFTAPVDSLNHVEFSTTPAAQGSFALKPLRIHKGYGLFEDFEASMSSLPDGWLRDDTGGAVGAAVLRSESVPDIHSARLSDTSAAAGTSLSAGFSATGERSVVRYQFLLPSKIDGVSASVRAGGATAVELRTCGDDLCYVDNAGTEVVVWPAYRANVWYDVKLVVDPGTDSVDIAINGKVRATGVALRSAVDTLTGVAFQTPAAGTGTLWVDDVSVSPFVPLPGDYVPAVQPAPSAGYNVGVQSFPGWKAGTHVGWDWVAPFPVHDQYLGTYDEESPESSDWQSKWMAEHGIDFFFEAWYGIWSPQDPGFVDQGAAMKRPTFGHRIHDAYFEGEYSDSVEFAISDFNVKYSPSYFRNVIVPFWMEHYFRDPRYMTIDNKVVIGLNNYPDLRAAMGGPAAVRTELDWLRSQLVAAGFDGAYIVTRYEDTDRAMMDEMYSAGFDYVYYYSFFTNDTNQMRNSMNASRDVDTPLKALPTVSVGWGTEAWLGGAGEWVSGPEFESLARWVRDDYMPNGAVGTLERDTVLIDNWNEYGEGHWITPSNLAGFGYLDGLRTTYVGAGGPSDARPTESQKRRMNRQYPKSWIGRAWNFDSQFSDTEGWSGFNVSGLRTSDGTLEGSILSDDAGLVSRGGLNIPLADNPYVTIRLRNATLGTAGRVYFATTTSPGFSEARSKAFTLVVGDPQYTDYLLDMRTVPGWSGSLDQLRVDVVNEGASSGSFSIDSIQVTDEAALSPGPPAGTTATMNATPFATTGPAGAIDGSLATYAQADAAVPWDLTVDFGQVVQATGVQYTPDVDNYATAFTIEGSQDGSTYTVLAAESTGTGTGGTYTFESTSVRYVRLNVSSAVSAGNWGHAVRELQVSTGGGGSVQRTAVMTATAFPGFGPEQTLDGQVSTYAQATSPTPWDLTVDLGRVEDVGTVAYVPDVDNYATVYAIETSTDGVTFSPVASENTGTGTGRVLTFAPVSARYIRFAVADAVSAGNWGHAIREFAISG